MIPPPDQAEFSLEELDSLQVGENLQAAEERMLAGKYENAEQLERAYLNPVKARDASQQDAEEMFLKKSEDQGQKPKKIKRSVQRGGKGDPRSLPRVLQ